MLKILIYDTNFVPGISRVIPLTKIRYWQKRGCEITILGTKQAEEFYRSQVNGLKYLSLDFKYEVKNSYVLIFEVLKINLLVLFKIRSLIGKFDIIYSQSSVIDFLLIPWFIRLLDSKVKWFVMVDNIVPPPHKRPGSYLHNLIPYLAFLIGDFLMKTADGIFVVSDYLKSHYLKSGMKKVIKTNDGYGIQVELFQDEIPADTPKVNGLYCGRLHLAKGIMDLVEMAKIIIKRNPDFKMGILGDGPEEVKKKFLERIKQEYLENNFTLFGYIADKRKGNLYRNCDFYISLSYDEGFGHAILEALACNKPAIAYDLPVYHEVFGKNIATGQLKLFKKKDYTGIADYILKGEFEQLKFNNRLENYGWETICRKELKSFL